MGREIVRVGDIVRGGNMSERKYPGECPIALTLSLCDDAGYCAYPYRLSCACLMFVYTTFA